MEAMTLATSDALDGDASQYEVPPLPGAPLVAQRAASSSVSGRYGQVTVVDVDVADDGAGDSEAVELYTYGGGPGYAGREESRAEGQVDMR